MVLANLISNNAKFLPSPTTSSKPKNALGILKQAIAIDSKEPQAHYYIGIAYREMKEFNKAATSLQHSVLLKPDSLKMQYSLGLVLINCGKYQSACDAFHEAVRVKPDFAEGHYMLGYIYLEKLSETEKAINHLNKAEKLYIKLDDFERLEKVRAILSKER